MSEDTKQTIPPGIYEITIPGKPIPQGRPKFTSFTPKKGGRPIVKVYYNKTSKAYRKVLDTELEEMFGNCEPISTPCSVTIQAWGMNKNADPDNLAKQIMDAMVGPVLKADSWPIVRVLEVMCFEAKPDDRGLKITLHVWDEGAEL